MNREQFLEALRAGRKDFSGSEFEAGIDLSGLYMRGIDFSGAELIGANLSNSDLSGSDLSGADLFYAILIDTDLSYADLSYADLTNINLTQSDLSYTNLNGADLTGIAYTNMVDVDLSTLNLTDANFQNAIGNNKEIITGGFCQYRVVLCIPTRMVWIGSESGTPEYWLSLTEEQSKELYGNEGVEFYRKDFDLVMSFIRDRFNIKE